MDAIKSFLKPGAKEEDTTLYGSEAEREHAGRQTSTVADDSQAARNAQSHLNEPVHEPGVVRQLVNPNHDKYNETQYGPAGSTTARDTLPPSVPGDATLHTKPEAQKNEGGILRQILNPGGTRYDDVAYGTTATTTPHSSSTNPTGDQSGLSRQTLNPSGQNYDETRHGMSSTDNTTGLTGSSSTNPTNTTGSTTDNSLSQKVYNGVTGHNSSNDRVVQTAAGPRIPGSSITAPGLAAAAVNDGTTDDSSLAAGHVRDQRHLHESGTGGLTHHNHNETPIRSVDTAAGPRVPGSSISAPGLASAAVNDGTTDTTTGSSTTTDSQHHLGRDAGLAGGAGAAGLAGYEASRHTGATGSSAQQSSNLPHIPATGGEFLSGSNTGTTTGHTGSTHHAGNDGRAGLASAAGGALDADSSRRRAVEDGWQPHEHQGHGHHYDGPALGSDPTPVAGSSSGPHVTRIANLLDPSVSGGSSSGIGSSTTGHTGSSHLGRDAALVGGAGAAGGAAYGSSNTGPAPNTIGQHDKDWKNVLDPRVTPDLSKQSHGSTTTGTTTDSSRGISHATGDSKVPLALQKAVPESAERALPDSIHDTSGSRTGAATGATGAAGLAAGSAGHHHDGTADNSYTSLPHREFKLGTTNDPDTQHGFGRDHTQHRDDHSSSTGTTGATGAGLAGLTAGSAAHHHQGTTSGTTGTTSSTNYGTSPVIGERGIPSESANPYSSKGLDPRVDSRSAGTTSSSTGVSHATGDSKVPLGLQKAVPESAERALPDSIHDTSGSRAAGAAGAAGLAGTSSTTHGHSSGTSTLPQRDFNLGTTSDPATQHGVGRDHVGGTTAGTTTTSSKQSSSQQSSSQQNAPQPDPKHGHHYGIPHREHHQHNQPEQRNTPSIFAHDVKDAAPPKFGDERQLDTLDYKAQGGAQEHRGLGEHRTRDSQKRSAAADTDTSSGNVGGSGGGATGPSGRHGTNTSVTDSAHHDEHHEKKQGFLSKLLHRHKDDDVATGNTSDHNKLHKDQH